MKVFKFNPFTIKINSMSLEFRPTKWHTTTNTIHFVEHYIFNICKYVICIILQLRIAKCPKRGVRLDIRVVRNISIQKSFILFVNTFSVNIHFICEYYLCKYTFYLQMLLVWNQNFVDDFLLCWYSLLVCKQTSFFT